MRKKLSKGIVAAAVFAYWSIYPFAATSVEWQPGMQIQEDLTISSGSNFSNYSGPNQGNLVNWGTGTVTVSGEEKAVFNTNTGVQDAGGALYNAYGATTIVDSVSEFTNNASNRGGAVWNNGILTFNDKAVFDSNKATTTAISNDMAGGAINNSSYQNTATSGLLTFNNGVEFKNNSAVQGGALKQGGKLVVTGGAVFRNNHATGGDGGAVLNAQGWGEPAREDSYDTLSVFDNSATGNGGAYAVKGSDGSLTVTGEAGFFRNHADVSGGAIYNEGSLGLANSSFGEIIKNADNEIIGAQSGNSANVNGGAIFNYKGNATFTGSNVFAGNHSNNQGGAVMNFGSGATVDLGDNAVFAYNTASSVGGAISTVDTGSVLNTGTIIGDNAQFIGNTSGMQGGAIHNQRANTEIGDNATFQNNKAIGYGGGAIYQDTDGAAITLTIGDNAKFIGNSTESSHGGAIMSFRASDVNNATLSIGEGALFENNTAAKTGGAISNFYGAAEIEKGASFKGNHAGTNGGAIYNEDWGTYGATLTVKGGASADGKTTTFEGNTADGQGGAIYNAANMELNTADGDINFVNNTANGIANDILAATDSETNITGGHNVSIGSGIETAAGSSLSIGGTASLIIEEGVKGQFAGAVTSESGAYLVNNGETTFSGVNETATGGKDNSSSANIKNNADLTISGESSSKITNDGNVTVSGKYNGNFTQKDKDSTFTIASGSEVTVSEANTDVQGGTVIIEDKNALVGDLAITEAVKLEIQGGSTVIDADGLKIGASGHIINKGTGSLNLSGDYLVDGGVLGASVIISNGAINAQPAGPLTIDNSKVLTLSDNATSDGAFVVGANGTLKLAPKTGESLTLSSNNNVTGSGQVLVDEIIVTEQTYDPSTGTYTPTTLHYGVGTVNLANDNSGFSGTYLQKMGNVIAQAGSKFFGGTNTVEGGSLTLQKGADLTVDVSATDNVNGGYGTINIYNDIEGTVGSDGINRIADTDITNGVVRYVNSDGTTKNVNITKAGLGLFNGTRVEGDTNGTLSLVSTAGVRDLTFGNGSGSEADVISLGSDTNLTYKDNAYIKDDSKVELGANATLNFDNETTNIEYRPVITAEDATALIAKTGAGETVISSTLKDFHGSVEVGGGSLELANEEAISLNNITVGNGDLSIAADTTANKVTVGNDSEFVAKKSLTVGSTLTVDNSQATFNGETRAATADFKGSDSVVNLKGAAFFGNMNLNGATMNAYNNVNVTGTMALSNTPTISLVSGGVNTINVDGTLNMNTNANISFDLDPRSQAIDSIIADNIFNNSGSKLLITGINMTRSPIDRNVAIDISNLLKDSSGSKSDMVALPEGGIITRTAMGDYAITSTSSSNMFNAALLAINPQMYRAQVATLASWQNQLVVNNMMFDHMQVVTRQLMDDAKTANKYSAILPQFAPYQYSAKDGNLWYKAYGNFERLSMTRGLSVGNNAYGSLIGADFPLIDLKNGWKIVPTAYVGYNGGHQTYDGVSMYQNGAQLGLMGTAYKGDFLTSLLVYGGGYGNDMSVRGSYGSGSDTTGNWFAGVASKTAYNIHLPHDFIFQPTAMVTYNAFGNQNWGSSFGAMSMNAGMLNGINAAPGFNLIWNKKTFSIYATAQMVYNIMGGVDGRAGNVDLGYVRMRHSYFEYGFGVMKRFKDTFNGYLQMTFRNGGRTGVGFQGGIQWKPGRDKK